MAPHVVSQAVKTAVFCAGLLEEFGFIAEPSSSEVRHDIIQSAKLMDKEKLIKFCGGLQSASPIDSFVVPCPWAMPGYNDEVIMAAGAFNQGSSIELSADAPVKEPYIVYMQGGLTFESGKIGVMKAVSDMLK
jgi:cystathionine beta-lyase family protein involved in aluminum resistance